MPATRAKSAGREAPATRGRATRKRQNLLVNQDSLRRAMAALGSTNMSETVNAALDQLADNAAILRGMAEAAGAIPDFPYIDT